MSYQITIQPSGHVYEAKAYETVLEAAIEAGFNIPYGCRNGACGSCKGSILSGEVDYGDYARSALTEDEKAQGKALFCCARPLSDLTIECREVMIGAIPPRILPARVEKKYSCRMMSWRYILSCRAVSTYNSLLVNTLNFY